MKYAKIIDGVVQELGEARELFPNTSFSAAGPNDDFLQTFGLLPVRDSRPFDAQSQLLVPSAPYIEGNVVYTVQVLDIPPSIEQDTIAAGSGTSA